MQVLAIVFALLSIASISLAKECPKFTTQDPFDIKQVRILSLHHQFNGFEFSMLDFGMKLIEMIFSSKLVIDVLMQPMD